MLSAVSAVGVGDHEVGLEGLLGVPVGRVAEVVEVRDAGSLGAGGKRDVEGPADVVGSDLLEGGVEEEGGGVVAGEVDDADRDDVGAGAEHAVGTADEPVGGGALASGGPGRRGDVAVGEVLSDELDAVHVDDIAGAGLDSHLKALVAGGVHADGRSEEPNVVTVRGRGVDGVEGAEAADGAGSIPVVDEGGGVGPGGGLGVDVEPDLVGEVVAAAEAVVDVRDDVVVTLAVSDLDAEGRACGPSVAVAICEVDVDDASGETVQEVLGGVVGEGGGDVGLTIDVGDGVGLLVGPVLTDLHESDEGLGGTAAELDVQGDLCLTGLAGDVAGGGHGVGARDGLGGGTADDAVAGSEEHACGEGGIDLEVAVSVDGGRHGDGVDVGVAGEGGGVVAEAGDLVGKDAGVAVDLGHAASPLLAAGGDVQLVLAVAVDVGSQGVVVEERGGGEDDVVLDVEGVPVGAVVGAVERPGGGVAVVRGGGGHDGVVVDPLGPSVLELVIDDGVAAVGCGVAGGLALVEELVGGEVDGGRLGIRGGRAADPLGVAEVAFVAGASEERGAGEEIRGAAGPLGEVHLIGDGEGAGDGEEVLVGGDDHGVGSVGDGGGGRRGDGAGGHVVSVDLGALEVVDEAVGVVDGGVEGGNGGAVGEGACEAVVTGGGGEGGEAAGSGGGPVAVVEGVLGPGVGGLGSIGVLPLGEGGRDEADGEGGGSGLEDGAGLVGQAASEDSDASDSDVEVGRGVGVAPAVSVHVVVHEVVVRLFEAEAVGPVGAGIGGSAVHSQEEGSVLVGSSVELEALVGRGGGVVLGEDGGELVVDTG